MSNKNIFLFNLILILLIGFVSAAPPIVSSDQFTEGFIIKLPTDTILKADTAYKFDFHIFNISNGLPITSGISCYFHLYDNTGNHKLTLVNTTANPLFDYGFTVGGKNFTNLGYYYYNIQCNNSNLGGAGGSLLLVTPSGNEIEPARSTIIIGSMLIILLISITFFIIAARNESRTIKLIFYTFSTIFFLILVLYTTVIAQQTLWGFEAILSGVEAFWFIIKIAMTIGILVFFVVIFMMMLRYWNIWRGKIDEED